MNLIKRHYPFNTEQTVNILGEFGPLLAMFIVMNSFGLKAGVAVLILTTIVAMVAMYMVLRRLPVFPFIAGSVTILTGLMTWWTGDGFWVQIKVTVFNLAFAVMLWVGLYLKKNFFEHIFHKTFHYTPEGWRRFTHNFALFFVATAVANELVRILFSLEAWMLFKLFIVMPAAGVFAFWQTKVMAKYKLDGPDVVPAAAALGVPPTGDDPGRAGEKFDRARSERPPVKRVQRAPSA